MPKWEDSRVAQSTEEELADLKKVVDVVSQLPRNVAQRIIRYAWSMVSKEADLLPALESKKQTIMDMVAEKMAERSQDIG